MSERTSSAECSNCSGLANAGVPDESVMGQRLRIGLSVNCLSQTEVDYFHQQLCIVGDVGRFAIGRDEHQVRWL